MIVCTHCGQPAHVHSITVDGLTVAIRVTCRTCRVARTKGKIR